MPIIAPPAVVQVVAAIESPERSKAVFRAGEINSCGAGVFPDGRLDLQRCPTDVVISITLQSPEDLVFENNRGDCLYFSDDNRKPETDIIFSRKFHGVVGCGTANIVFRYHNDDRCEDPERSCPISGYRLWVGGSPQPIDPPINNGGNGWK